MKILMAGDIHGKTDALKWIRQEFDLTLISGDLTQMGNREDALRVLDHFRFTTPDLLAVAGNMDLQSTDELLSETGLNLHGQGKIFGELGIFGCGGSSPTPFQTPREFSEEEIFQALEDGYHQVSSAAIKIMVCHTPPFDTRFDKVRPDLHAGSTAVRQWIETHQPHYCLTGHIHESIAKGKLGKTLVINPGPFQNGCYAILDTETRWAELFSAYEQKPVKLKKHR